MADRGGALDKAPSKIATQSLQHSPVPRLRSAPAVFILKQTADTTAHYYHIYNTMSLGTNT